ncbi:hypothetical protein BUALT_Bualt19G0038800 [Buddleja alternifolia]|uniref:Uncharacterized protein n=1 Tax=Buddleja alternifolia TaxID=168488 RepID=A0AAV6VZT2_9LAMI|nr:hypothetical protein BUALT_Bualt19G0038800 [Buddleja alternifolia]
MEVAIIDWKRIDSRFVKDELYEHINAPKWIDFNAPDDPVDDEAWFCRPGCNHPKTVDDFFSEKERTPISNSKLQKSASISDIPPFGDRNKRDATLKKRGINQPSVLSNKDTKYNRVVEDGENQDPNLSTPPSHKVGKNAIKSSTERKQLNDTNMRKVQMPKLKSTLSARNLFSGGDILNKVAEFCNELKNMATRGRDKEDGENVEKQMDKDPMNDDLNDKEKERKPLLEMSKEKSEVMGTSGSKGKLRRKKRNDDAENTPISVDLKNIKGQEEGLLQIRTCPPTPQCFSATCETPKSTTTKPFRPRPPERGILQEVKQINKEVKEKKNDGGEVADKEARSLDVFWFLKPCTLSS